MPGCSLCTNLAKLAVLEAMLSTVSQWPRVSIDMFIDDLTFNAVGGRQQVTQDIGEAAESFAEKIRPMGCEVAPAKTAVVGSDAETARALRLAVGADNFEEQGVRTTFLGADFAAGRPRRQWQKQAQFRKRRKATKRRQGRVLQLRRAAGRRAHHIVKTGLLPQAGYGANIVGLSDADLDDMRRIAEMATGG